MPSFKAISRRVGSDWVLVATYQSQRPPAGEDITFNFGPRFQDSRWRIKRIIPYIFQYDSHKYQRWQYEPQRKLNRSLVNFFPGLFKICRTLIIKNLPHFIKSILTRMKHLCKTPERCDISPIQTKILQFT